MKDNESSNARPGQGLIIRECQQSIEWILIVCLNVSLQPVQRNEGTGNQLSLDKNISSCSRHFVWNLQDGVNYCTVSLNQHIPQMLGLYLTVLGWTFFFISQKSGCTKPYFFHKHAKMVGKHVEKLVEINGATLSSTLMLMMCGFV